MYVLAFDTAVLATPNDPATLMDLAASGRIGPPLAEQLAKATLLYQLSNIRQGDARPIRDMLIDILAGGDAKLKYLLRSHNPRSQNVQYTNDRGEWFPNAKALAEAGYNPRRVRQGIQMGWRHHGCYWQRISPVARPVLYVSKDGIRTSYPSINRASKQSGLHRRATILTAIEFVKPDTKGGYWRWA